MAHGASKNNIARALDGGRAADIALAPQADDGGESGRRRELNDYTFARRHKNRLRVNRRRASVRAGRRGSSGSASWSGSRWARRR